jgi:hypothetical protein
MGTLGSLIFLLVIVAQGVSAVVVALKKRQEAREKAAGKAARPDASVMRPPTEPTTPPREPQAPVSASPVEDAIRNRDAMVKRRREQIEELRARAQSRTAKTPSRPVETIEQPPSGSSDIPTRQRTAQRTPARPPAPSVTPPVVIPAPVRQVPRMAPVTTPAPLEAEENWSPPVKRSAPRLRKYRSMLNRGDRIRDLIVLKELLDPPLALRQDASGRG